MISPKKAFVVLAIAGTSLWLYSALRSAPTPSQGLRTLTAPLPVEETPSRRSSGSQSESTGTFDQIMASTAKPQELDERLLPEAAPTILQQTVPRIAENRMATARATLAPMVADMTSVAGLSNYEADQLLTVMAESLLRGKDAQSECSATPGCDISKIRPELQRARRREIERILPLAKLQRLDYMDENARVKVFRSDLPSGLGLSETLANELALSLSEERYRFAGEDETNEAFNSRLYLRAQRLLTAEQLAKFKELQSTLFARDN